MRVSLRLLILLVCLAFVTPKLIEMWGGGYTMLGMSNRLEQQHEDAVKGYQDSIDQQKNSFQASIDQIYFQDDNLKTCVEQHAKRYGAVHPQNSGSLKEITDLPMLQCSGRGIKSINALRKFQKLTSLDLSNNDIKTLDALSGHKSLKSLRIEGNSNLEYIDSLLSVYTLMHVSFSDVPKVYCYKLQRLLDHVKQNRGDSGTAKDRFFGKDSVGQGRCRG